ncbi:M24 family metallopeptidase [Desulforhabdus amnigena]|jgi:Xaa-Pro dipeptidase|uniref:Aminopeptidase n=1 Tax=Desulforhabdus amnigena TaxID=40218 RepID=A0A9W6CZ87_9BACT|nr:Xaa-Pro peptidase family protein [Desulforhabdus amnigena]NLJ27704.1 aminopeptidase P family protein [Deltaproteobacteria bacterium]GLI33007.1 aminopeptidase [Desulforhabdus amnigena]
MTLGMMATDAEQRIDFEAMRSYKLKRIQAQLAEKDLGAMLCFDPDNVRYATSTAIGEWSRDKYVRWCVVPREGEPYLFELGSAQEVKKEICPWIPSERIFPGGGWLRGANTKGATSMALMGTVARIKAVLEASKVAEMAIGIDTVDLYMLDALKSAGLKIVNGWDVMWDARLIKCPQELTIIETAASLADGCFEYIADKIRPGVRESEIVAEIYGWLLKQGCDRVTGVNCVSGPRSNPHPHDFSDRMIRPGELVFIDIMAHYLGYGTCYYRTFAATRTTQKQKDLYKKAHEWLQASIEVVRPGITTADIANQWPTAQELGYPDELAAAGLCVGHGIGVSIHEKPFITRLFSAEPMPIEAGMHFALETFCGEGVDGARIEQQIIVTETGHKVITQWPCDELMVCSAR